MQVGRTENFLKPGTRLLTRTILFIALVTTFSLPGLAQSAYITSLSPSVGPVSPVGGPVSIKGTGFGITQGGSTVTFGGITVTPTSWSATKIVVPLPGNLPVDFLDVIVTVNGVASNTKYFLVIPVITAVSPTSAPIGAPVTVTGISFGDLQGTSTVTLNGVTATPSSWSNTSITAPVPAGAAYGSLVVTVNGFQTNGVMFPVLPNIAALSSSAGPIGSLVTITGTSFEATQGFGGVTFNGVSATVQSWSDTNISTLVPSGTTTGNVIVTTQRLLHSNALNFAVGPPSGIIGSVTPTSGVVGSQVTIAGSNFGSVQGSSSVTFNGVSALVASWTDSSITVLVPPGASTGSVVVLVSGATSSNSANFIVLPTLVSLSPTSGAVGSVVTITGSGFGATQGTGSVVIGNLAMPVTSWSDSSIVATVPSGALANNIFVTTGAGLTSNGLGFDVNTTGPLLQFSVADDPLQVNLTSPQILDWIHWGRISVSTPDRKAGITPLISDYTPLNTQPLPGSGTVAFSWTDGNHPPIVSQANEDVATFDPNGGFQITVPADTTMKTLNLYVEVLFGQGQLQATLSDGSAAAISDQSIIDTDIGSKVYSIDFRAASSGQTLTVTFSALSGGVALQAATLGPHVPVVAVTSPTAAQSFAAADTIPLSARATQFDYAVTDVSLTAAGAAFDVPNPPYTASFTPATTGHYSVVATATDSAGLVSTSAPVEFDVIGQGGTISIDENPTSSPIDLNIQGTGDWVLWGPLNTGDFIINNPGNIQARKSGVAPLISDYTPIGNHPISSVTFAHPLCFLGDQQNYCSGSQLAVHGLHNGYQLTVAADTNPRTLQLYVGIGSGDGTVTAFLSDGSAPVAVEIGGSGPPPPPNNTTLYTINYSAASAGQTLTVRFTLNSDQGSGVVDLIGAALSGPAVTPVVPAPQIASINPGTGQTNTNVTLTGTNFGATQGNGQVLFGQVSAQVATWSDTSIAVIVPATISQGSTVGVTVFNANGTSNRVNFTLPSYNVFPSSLNLLVGQSRTLTAKDSNGQPVTGLQWTAGDLTIVSLSSDDPPVITALAAGSTKVYAGDLGIPVAVFAGAALPAGTPIWSVPLGSGSSVASLVPAVPSDSGVDVFALDNSGTLTAITADGVPVWSVSGLSSAAKLIPDFSGGTFLKSPKGFADTQGTHNTHVAQKVDSATGQLTDLYTFSDRPDGPINFSDRFSRQTVIPHPAGMLFVQDNTSVSVIDPVTGQSLANITLDKSVFNSQESDASPGHMIVAGDGNAYLPYLYEVGTLQSTGPDSFDFDNHSVSHLMVLRVSADGTSAKTELRTWTSDLTCVADPSTGSLDHHCVNSGLDHPGFASDPAADFFTAITNADQGIAVFANVVTSGCTNIAVVSGQLQQSGCVDSTIHTSLTYAAQDAVTSQVGDAFQLSNTGGQRFTPVLQREDGSYKATAYSGDDGIPVLIAVGASGSPLWQLQLPAQSDGSPTPITPLYATASGGAIATSTTTAQDGTAQLGTLFTVDKDGSANGQSPDLGTVLSWSGKSYAMSSLGIGSYTPLAETWASSFWPFQGGGPSPKSSGVFITVHFGPGPKTPGDNLSFLGPRSPDCSDDLGLLDCATAPTAWRWNVDIQASVSDDASKWVATQSLTLRKKGFWKDFNGTLHAFDISENRPNDGPQSFALQQPTGQKTIFWIDSVGHGKSLAAFELIDSMTQIENFTSRICSKQAPSYCVSVKWFVKLVIQPGAKLDRDQSRAGLGTLPTNF